MIDLPGPKDLPDHAPPEAWVWAAEIADLRAMLAKAQRVEDTFLAGSMLVVVISLVLLVAILARFSIGALLAAAPMLFFVVMGVAGWRHAEREVSRISEKLAEAEHELAPLLEPPPSP